MNLLYCPPREASNESIQKWNEQVEHQKRRAKVPASIGIDERREDELEDSGRRNGFISSRQHNEINHIVIKNPFKGNFAVALNGKRRGAHEVSANQNENIDAGFAPHSPESQKGELGGVILKGNGLHDAGIHDIVVRNDEKHADNAQQLDIALTLN